MKTVNVQKVKGNGNSGSKDCVGDAYGGSGARVGSVDVLAVVSSDPELIYFIQNPKKFSNFSNRGPETAEKRPNDKFQLTEGLKLIGKCWNRTQHSEGTRLVTTRATLCFKKEEGMRDEETI